MRNHPRTFLRYAGWLGLPAIAFHILSLGLSNDAEPIRFEWDEAALQGHCLNTAGEPALHPGATGECADMRGGEISGFRSYTGKTFRGSNLSGLRFSRVQMSDSDFSAAILNSADLRKAKADGSRFMGAALENVQAFEAQFTRADFRNAKLTSGHFEKSDMREARFGGASIHGAVFTHADLRGADLSDVHGFFHASFGDAKFDEHTRFPPAIQANLANLILLQSMSWTSRTPVETVYPVRSMRIWRETQSLVPEFSYSYTDRKCLNEAGEEGYNPSFFGDCGDLREVAVSPSVVDFNRMKKFRGTLFTNLNLRTFPLRDVLFEGASLVGSNFTDSEVWSVDFRGADLRSADFTRARISSASFYGSDLRGAKFVESEFAITQVQNSDLRGADFTRARIMIMRMSAEGARFDGATIWPSRDGGEAIPLETLLHEGLRFSTEVFLVPTAVVEASAVPAVPADSGVPAVPADSAVPAVPAVPADSAVPAVQLDSHAVPQDATGTPQNEPGETTEASPSPSELRGH